LVVSVAKANLRAGPDTNAKILAVLPKGTRLAVISKGNQWYRVRLDNGTEGWLAESVVAPGAR
jgi:SH3-like domain-containing protein